MNMLFYLKLQNWNIDLYRLTQFDQIQSNRSCLAAASSSLVQVVVPVGSRLLSLVPRSLMVSRTRRTDHSFMQMSYELGYHRSRHMKSSIVIHFLFLLSGTWNRRVHFRMFMLIGVNVMISNLYGSTTGLFQLRTCFGSNL